jgi:hypothetical protein
MSPIRNSVKTLSKATTNGEKGKKRNIFQLPENLFILSKTCSGNVQRNWKLKFNFF